MIFFDTTHCRSRFHCRTCRDRKGITLLRKQMREQHEEFPEGEFDCPEGIPWLTPKTAGQFAELGKLVFGRRISDSESLAARRIEAHCRRCENFRDRRCLLYREGHCTACEFAVYLNRPGAICPLMGQDFHLLEQRTFFQQT